MAVVIVVIVAWCLGQREGSQVATIAMGVAGQGQVHS